MNVDIRTELQAVIDKSLPSLEAQRLRSYIEEAEQGKKQLAIALEQVQKGTDRAKADAAVIADLIERGKQKDAVIAEFQAREKDFKTSELAVMLAQHSADKADGMRQATLDVVALFTRNPEIRREHWTSKTTPIFSAPMPGSTPYQNGTSSESTSAGTTERSE